MTRLADLHDLQRSRLQVTFPPHYPSLRRRASATCRTCTGTRCKSPGKAFQFNDLQTCTTCTPYGGRAALQVAATRPRGGRPNRGQAIRQKRQSSCRTAPEACVVAEIDEVSSYTEGNTVFCRFWCSKHGAYYWRWLPSTIVDGTKRAREVAT